ncbi:hypothetical protein FHU38_004808 [Saccharomonospora amisosensis]|uniref:Sortase family protein n=1 Tax=Saccharomonospora amisosensis TaxID=1128677 RepID=A0A7X5UV74_9PSEU|nr:hypothetical protein [Saccharomonospora amisosensis]
MASPLLALVAVVALSSCSPADQEIDLAPQHPATTGETTTTTDSGRAPGHEMGQGSTGLPRSEPAWLDVPAIDAHSSLVPLGLNPDRTVAVPPVHEPMQAGWYRYSPTPGERGPAVILGHVNGDGRDGIFVRLRELERGDEIRVGREDGTVARFTVKRMAQVPKDRFPTDDVYGDTAGPELRLITCGGPFDETAHSYRDNIIAFATFTGVGKPTR